MDELQPGLRHHAPFHILDKSLSNFCTMNFKPRFICDLTMAEGALLSQVFEGFVPSALTTIQYIN